MANWIEDKLEKVGKSSRRLGSKLIIQAETIREEMETKKKKKRKDKEKKKAEEKIEVDSSGIKVIEMEDLDIEGVEEQQYSQMSFLFLVNIMPLSAPKDFQYEKWRRNCYKYFKSEVLLHCNRNYMILEYKYSTLYKRNCNSEKYK